MQICLKRHFGAAEYESFSLVRCRILEKLHRLRFIAPPRVFAEKFLMSRDQQVDDAMLAAHDTSHHISVLRPQLLRRN
jgi:hypothetical protein